MGSGSSHDGIDEDEMDELKRGTNFSGHEIREMHEKFQADFPEGVITRDRFVTMYMTLFPDGDATRFAEHVFRAYDVDGNGVVDFQEFMATLSVAAKGTMDEKLRWAFNLYDLDGNGTVTRSEATEMIMAIYRMQGVTNAKEKAEKAAVQFFVFPGQEQGRFPVSARVRRRHPGLAGHSGPVTDHRVALGREAVSGQSPWPYSIHWLSGPLR